MHDHGSIAIFDYNRRNEYLDPASLLNRGYDQPGTPYAPCGCPCRSNGYATTCKVGSTSATDNVRLRSGDTARAAMAF
jgi:hypothetical protein